MEEVTSHNQVDLSRQKIGNKSHSLPLASDPEFSHVKENLYCSIAKKQGIIPDFEL